MREHGILFKAEMVRAILDGRKTQTRRLVKPQPAWAHNGGGWYPPSPAPMHPDERPPRARWYANAAHVQRGFVTDFSPWTPGDRLWVRETWAPHADEEETCRNHQRSRAGNGSISEPGSIRPQVFYRADGGDPHIARWRPSLLMPRWASRITLEVVSVRVEHLQAITEEDAIREGVSADDIGQVGVPCYSARQNFERLWASINGPESWDANPWVWRIEFRRLP